MQNPDIFPGLSLLEKQCCEDLPFNEWFHLNIQEGWIDAVEHYLAEYSREVNRSLKDYAVFNFHTQRLQKIYGKAQLKYGYDLITLLTELLKILHQEVVVKSLISQKLIQIEEHLTNKTTLLNDHYIPFAKHELETFYSETIRQKMDNQLSKLYQKYHGNQSHHR